MISSGRIGEVRSGFTTFQDQRTFLIAVSQVCPEFWNSLRDEVLPHWPANVSIHSIWRGYLHPTFASIQPSFRAWIERFHIEPVAWLHQIALKQLRAWADYRDTWAENPEAPRGFFLASGSEWGDRILSFSFDWDRKLETLTAFESRIKREIRAAAGSDSTDKCKSPLPLSDLHATWLVLYQMAELSPSEILKRTASDGKACGREDASSTIRHGCESAAERLNIALRPQRRGRPRQ